MMGGIDYDICMTQSRIYKYIAQCGYDVNRFSDAFLMSDFCRRAFDTIYSRFQELSKPQASPIWTDFIHQSLVAQKELMAGVKKTQ